MLRMRSGSAAVKKACELTLWQDYLWQGARLQSSLASATSHVSDNVKSFDDIPGPKGLPYFGTYFKYKLGIIDKTKLFDAVKQWHQQYGTVFKEICVGQTIIHLSDPEDIRMIYANEGRLPRIEPLAEPSLYYRQKKGISLGLGNTNDEEWYRLRGAVQQMMMRPKEVVPFLPESDEVAVDFVQHMKYLRDNNMEVPDFSTQLGRWILESSGTHCFNTRLGYLTEDRKKEAEDILAATDTMFQKLTDLFATIPFYKYTRAVTPQWKRLFSVEDFLYDIFLKHFNTAMDRLRAKMDSGSLESGELRFIRYLMSKSELTLNDVAIVTHSLLYDPIPTVKPQLQFMLYLLAVNPEAQEKLYKEICSVAPPYPSPLTTEHVSQLVYLKACFRESVRMLPMINENKRITRKDMVLGGYHVPADTLVFLNNFVLYRHPDFFTDPDTFLPERWLREESDHNVDKSIVQPFSHGARMCIGRRFAEQDIAVLTTRLLQNFRLEWHHEPMGVKYRILNIPNCPSQYTFYDRLT